METVQKGPLFKKPTKIREVPFVKLAFLLGNGADVAPFLSLGPPVVAVDLHSKNPIFLAE